MSTLVAIGRLLWLAERAGPTFAGPLVVEHRDGSGTVGRIFVESGRLRWAAASGFNTRLLPMLATEAGLSLDALQGKLREVAMLTGSVEDGLLKIDGLSEEQLRRAFLHHTAAVVTFLASRIEGDEARLLQPEAEPLAESPGRFAFTTLEVLSKAFESAPELSSLSPPLPRVFCECGPDHQTALCFLETEDPFLPALPIASHGACGGGLLPALDLLRQARRFRRGLFASDDPKAPFAGVIRAGNSGWVLTYEAPYYCIFRLEGAGEYGRILTHYRLGRDAATGARR